MSIKKIILPLIGFVIVISLLVYSFLASMASNSFEPRAFNSELWKVEKDNRVELVDDLINSKILDTLTQTELDSLLGESENDTAYFKEKDNLVYHLGPDRGLGIDSEWLVIWMKNGYVNRYEILSD